MVQAGYFGVTLYLSKETLEIAHLQKKIEQIKIRRSKGLSTIPSTLGEEKVLNPFLKFDNDAFIKSVGLKNKSNIENFRVIREMKDNF